jgi:PAS domain S-box-containing protein
MEATALVIRDSESGKPIQIQTNARNITERVKAEEALRDSEEKLRSVISQSLDGILIMDEEGRIIEWSRGQEKISGIPRHKAVGEFAWDIHQRMAPESERTPENLEIDKKLTFELLSKGNVMQGNLIQDSTIVDANGKDHLIQTLTFPIYTPRGYMAGSVSRDVTEMKKAEDALRESESRYRILAKNFPNGAVMLFDKDLRYIVADGMGLSHLNLDRKQLENHTIFEIYTPETNAILEPYYRAVLKGRTEVFEVPIGDLTYEVYAVPIKNETGEISFGMVMTQDITERKVAVQTLKSRAQYLSILNEITQNALSETDLETMMQKIVDLLAMMFTADHCYITGWNSEEKKPIPLAAFGLLRSGYSMIRPKPGEMTLTRAVVESGIPIVVDDLFHSEYISPRLANQFPSKSMLALPLIGGGLNLGAILIGYADQHSFTKDEIQRAEQVAAQIALSMYKVKLFEEVQVINIQLEKRVEDRTKDLALKNQELETFTYSVSHDLKAPLRGIDGYSRLLLEEHSSQIDEEGLSFLRTIRTAAGQMNQLIEDLLSYSRLERRTMTNNQVDIHTLVSNLILERKDDIRRNNINVIQEVPPRKLSLDEKALEQALRNLLDNAIKFSSNNIMPKIKVSIIRAEESKSILCVEDNGIGFEMKYCEKIFDIFQRLHLPEEYPGTGIGLALVKKAMQRIGGRAWAESQPGTGAKFYLEIPG